MWIEENSEEQQWITTANLIDDDQKQKQISH